ncbi:MAG TPA: hypothetical protein VLM40_23135 [Gemmata sp.]|nr:hypothetical protein [Gemmata sp.]
MSTERCWGRSCDPNTETITMRDSMARHWKRWRLASDQPLTGALNRLLVPAAVAAGELEIPGPDGIRHELVARVRREIAAGTYDTEEKWLAAEEALLRRIESGV